MHHQSLVTDFRIGRFRSFRHLSFECLAAQRLERIPERLSLQCAAISAQQHCRHQPTRHHCCSPVMVSFKAAISARLVSGYKTCESGFPAFTGSHQQKDKHHTIVGSRNKPPHPSSGRLTITSKIIFINH
jgi:hypothetical protein